MTSSIIFYTNEFLDELAAVAPTVVSNTNPITSEITTLKTKATEYRMWSAIDRAGSENFNFEVRTIQPLSYESPHADRTLANVVQSRARSLAAKGKPICVLLSRISLDQISALAALIRALDDYRKLDPIATDGTGSRLNTLTVYHHPSIFNSSSISNTNYATFISHWKDEHKSDIPAGFTNNDIMVALLKRYKDRINFVPFHHGKKLPKGGLGSRVSIPEDKLDGSSIIINLKCPLLKYEGDPSGWYDWMRYAETDMRFTNIRHTTSSVVVEPLENIECFYSVDVEEKIISLIGSNTVYPFDDIVTALKDTIQYGFQNTRADDGTSFIANTNIGTDGLKKDKFPYRFANTFVQNWSIGDTITYHAPGYNPYTMDVDRQLTFSTPANTSFMAMLSNGSIITTSNIADYDLTEFIIRK